MLDIKITIFPLNSHFRQKAEVFKTASVIEELKQMKHDSNIGN